jgi:hypothetical protein
VRVARRWRGAARATRAALLAASLSVLGWSLGWAPAPHAAAIGAGALLGAVWPVRDRERAALRWVGDRVGLAYETALETADGDDPFGLRAAVAVQGRLVVRDLAPPAPSPWWVPAALLAASLWAWGALLGAPWTLPWASPGSPMPGPAGAPPGEAVLPFEPDVEPPGEADAGEARVPESGGADGEGAPGGAPGEAGPGGAPSERDALERFVEGLREREPTPEDEASRAAAAAAAAEEAEGEGEGEPDDAATTPRAPDPGGEGERSDEASDGEASDETGAGDEGAGEQEAEAGGDGDQPGPAEAPSAEEGAAEGAESGSGEAAGAAGFDPGEEGGDAGLGAGVEGEAGEGLEEGGATPEALPSILGPGPETPVGGVALPGANPEPGTLPLGAPPAGFRQAVEQALIDGEVPVSYQEVIRNYFR